MQLLQRFFNSKDATSNIHEEVDLALAELVEETGEEQVNPRDRHWRRGDLIHSPQFDSFSPPADSPCCSKDQQTANNHWL